MKPKAVAQPASLPQPARHTMESLSDKRDAGDRVHVGPQAVSGGAHGLNPNFAPVRANPNVAQRQRLPGHEPAHVVRQQAGHLRTPFGLSVAARPGSAAAVQRFSTHAPTAAPAPRSGQIASFRGVVQCMKLYRFLNDKTPEAFKPKNPMSKAQILQAAKQIGGWEDSNQMSNEEMALLFYAELHAQNMLGTNNKDSPFLSLARDPETVAKSGTLREIVAGAKEVWEFEIDDKYIVPVGNATSHGEGEVLVWVPPGLDLKKISTYDPIATQNPYRTLTLTQINQGIRLDTWY